MRKDAKQNKQLLISAATELFKKQGPNVPLETVAVHAGVGIGTLYRHFSHRGDLMLSVLQAQLDIYTAFLEQHPGGETLIPDFLRLIGEGISIYAPATNFIQEYSKKSKEYGQIFDSFDQIADAVLGRAKQEGTVALWVTPDILHLSTTMLVGVYSNARFSGIEPDIDKAIHIILKGIESAD